MSRKRIVVKIGSSSLTNASGEIDEAKMTDHIQAIAALRKANHEVILVSSGAVAAGFRSLGYTARPVTIKGKQAAAAVGQSLLLQSYYSKLSVYDMVPAQILLTRGDFSNRDRYKNAFSTILELLERGVLPIINENDTVAIDELTFGDNDMLSALVSGFIHADQLIILTDINGIYDANPQKNPDAKRIDHLESVTETMLQNTDHTGSTLGTGGMKSKLEAAKTAMSLGVPVFVGQGTGAHKFFDVLAGKGDGTYLSNQKLGSINTKKQWIGFHSESAGALYVDQGAEEAILYNGRSLLPAGIFKVKGTFSRGDVVEVFGMNGLLGRGEVNYSSNEVKQAIQKRGNMKHTIQPMQEVIHRNRWVEIKQ